MLERRMNDGWKFWVDGDAFALTWSVPMNAAEVRLPHDAMIADAAKADARAAGNTGFRDAKNYNYAIFLDAPEEWKHKSVCLKFDGVYDNAFVYVNGELAAKNPYGYTTFYAPLGDLLKYGEKNEIRVQVRSGAMPNGRWYTGAGIYRDVWFLIADQTHIAPEGVEVKTLDCDVELATLRVNTGLVNDRSIPAHTVLVTEIISPDGEVCAREVSPAALESGEKRTISRNIIVDEPALWSDEHPALYEVHTTLLNHEGEALDESRDTIGIRTLALDARRGLRVNGVETKLRGACIHHDSGLCGAVTTDEIELRRVRILKEAGFNAIRMSHMPAAPALLRACDALGMYVMDEAFDMWNRAKTDFDHVLFFNEWWKRELAAMIRKDYNHPSVVLYSIGNEIQEIGSDSGAKMANELSRFCHSLDDSRFTTTCINGVFAAGTGIDTICEELTGRKGGVQGNVNDFMTIMDTRMPEIVTHPIVSRSLEAACAGVDVAGYNYMTARYESDAKDYPNRVMVGSETYPPQIAANWKIITKTHAVIGDFTWTGWDYRGEAGVGIPAYHWGEGGFGAAFPAQLAYVGDIDITGVRRPASYYREIVFGLRKDPYIAVQNPNHFGEMLIKTPWVISDARASWTWAGCEGRPAVVEVYAAGAEVELFCNGKSLGRKPAGAAAEALKSDPQPQMDCRVLFETTYEPGELAAVNYDENGDEIGRCALTTCGADRRIVLTREAQTIVPEDCVAALADVSEIADPAEYEWIRVQLTDADGTPAAEDQVKLVASVTGDAEIAGFGSGDPKPSYNCAGVPGGDGLVREMTNETFHGEALLILRRTGAGEAEVSIRDESRDLAADLRV